MNFNKIFGALLHLARTDLVSAKPGQLLEKISTYQITLGSEIKNSLLV